MKTLKFTFALIAFITFNGLKAQTVVDSILNLEVSIVYNSNMGYQVPTTQNLIFSATTPDSSGLLSSGGPSSSSTYVFDPLTTVYSFSIDSSGNPTTDIKVQSGITEFYTGDFGFTANTAATISVTAAFTTVPNGSYCAYMKRISTGEVFPILNDTMTITVPVNATYATDFILLVGPTITKTINAEICYGDGQGGIDVICKSSDWNYRIYDSSNNLILQENVFAPDTTIDQLAQASYTVVTSVSQIIVDSASFVVTGPAPIIPTFTISDYAPVENSTVNFTNGSSGATTYTWDFGDANSDNTMNTSHGYSTAGTYTITLTAYNGGCANVVTDSLTVFAAPFMFNNNPGDRNNPSANSSNTMREENQEIVVATEMHKITICGKNESREMQVELLNMNGQLISSQKTNSNTIEMTIENGGVYLLRVIFENGEVVTKNIAVL